LALGGKASSTKGGTAVRRGEHSNNTRYLGGRRVAPCVRINDFGGREADAEADFDFHQHGTEQTVIRNHHENYHQLRWLISEPRRGEHDGQLEQRLVAGCWIKVRAN
jgi:hypothetical protein